MWSTRPTRIYSGLATRVDSARAIGEADAKLPYYLTPGVYVEELPSSSGPMTAIGTSTTAFVGLAPGGPLDTPMRVTTWDQFALMFSDSSSPWNGPFMEQAFLAHAVYGYFLNGGRDCWIVRVGVDPSSNGELAASLTPDDFSGDVATRSGVGALSGIDDIAVVCAPDVALLASHRDGASLRDVQGRLIAHCESVGDRLAILDSPPALSPQDVLDWRIHAAGYDTRCAALYYPWIEVIDPMTLRPLLVPPCGHIAGLWSRTARLRGVHKAPANEVLRGAVSLGFVLNEAEQGPLNAQGINCVRVFPGRGIRVWGARTLSSDPEARYVHMRRLVMFVSASIRRVTAWAAFEPNDPRLWLQLRVSVASFLTRLWRDGALAGGTPSEAFYVKCDEETNPPDVVQAGQVTLEVGIAPARSAEFVILRISQFTAGAL